MLRKAVLSIVAVLALLPLAAFVPSPTLSVKGSVVTFTGVTGRRQTVLESMTVTFCDGSSWSRVPSDDEDNAFYDATFYSHDFGKRIAMASAVAEQEFGDELETTLTAVGDCASTIIPKMWLLTRGGAFDPKKGNYPCIIISETAPSVERQNALCFPKTDPKWVADNAPCAGPVVALSFFDYRGAWACDALMQQWHGTRQDLYGPGGGLHKGTLYWVYQQHLKHLAS